MLGMFRSLWEYRHFIFNSIRNEFKSNFARSKLGGLWIIINPLSQVAIYALILSNVLAAKIPGIDSKYSYSIYLMAGLLAWTLFSEIISRCLHLFVAQGNLMKKMSFPRITLPAIALGSSLVNYFFVFVAMAGIFILLGHTFSFMMLWLIPLTFAVVIMGLGMGLFLGIVNVFIRDLGQVIPIILQVWFWFTPIVYPETIIPEAYRHLLALNPMYSIIHAYHQVLVYNAAPPFNVAIIVTSITSMALLFFSLFIFRRASPEMADVL